MTITVEYTDPADQPRTATLGSNQPQIAVAAKTTTAVKVTYQGADNEGVKSVHLEAEMTKLIGGRLAQNQHANFAPVRNACPKKYLADDWTHPSGESSTSLVVYGDVTNWVGATASTARLLVRFQ